VVSAVIYVDETVSEEAVRARAAQWLCALSNNEAVRFPLPFLIQWVATLPDRPEVPDEHHQASGQIESCGHI